MPPRHPHPRSLLSTWRRLYPHVLYQVKSNRRLRRTKFTKGSTLNGLENSLRKRKTAISPLVSIHVVTLYCLIFITVWVGQVCFLKIIVRDEVEGKVVYLAPSPLWFSKPTFPRAVLSVWWLGRRCVCIEHSGSYFGLLKKGEKKILPELVGSKWSLNWTPVLHFIYLYFLSGPFGHLSFH